MRIAHLTASPFFGGPERQMLGLALSLPKWITSVYYSFPERGLCEPFLHEMRRHGFEAHALKHNVPQFFAVIGEVRDRLVHDRIDLLCCHGYKADLLGRFAARRAGKPVVAVSRGWTGATWKVRLYEALDRFCLRWMDQVVCVSEGQAVKVRNTGVNPAKVRVIRNAIFTDRFGDPDEPGRAFLQSFFPTPRRWIVGAAGRFSPEKGFGDLVDAAAIVARELPDVGFLLFGEGPLGANLRAQIAAHGLQNQFVLAGFRDDLDRWLPNFDAFVLPSYTEGLPNVVLEALAARVPVIATAVGGTPEVLADGQSGYLVPPGNPTVLAQRINVLLRDERLRASMGMNGYYRVRDEFTFDRQASDYVKLFMELAPQTRQAAKTPDKDVEANQAKRVAP
jgi:glycosyltransferase involved in cell wall biosynthesis